MRWTRLGLGVLALILLAPGRPLYAARPPAPLRNDVARGSILAVEPVWQELELYGQGQVVAVADTGLDSGDTASLSADLAGRVRQAFAWGRPGDWSDPNGHGTHVAGSVLGSGVLSGSDPAAHRYAGSLAGVAPEAELVFQSLLDAEGGLGGLPDDLGELLRQAYDAGARVHTNSWGANFFIKPLTRFLTAGRYSPESAQVDRFLWEHPDLVVLFAAGNDGVDYLSPTEGGLELPPPDGVVDLESLASPGTAKNVITVGASESQRREGGHAAERWGGEGDFLSALLGYSFPTEPLASDLPSDNAAGMAPFSSRGPTNDGRIKPDVVAPGTNIVSARSHASGAGELFGAYDANYAYCSGTSMATPLVAGVVTLIRQWYVERQGVANPSAALLKATLINGAEDISPGQFGRGATQDVPDAWPNPVTGWGRVNLQASIAPGGGREVWFVDETQGLATGQEAVYTRWAKAGGEPLRVTLVWTDPPGPVEPEGIKLPGLTERPPPVLVNDLNLTVEAPDGRRFFGNMGESADRLNNVEAVRITDPPAGDYRIVVRGQQVAQGPQPFALVVAGQRVVSGREETGRQGDEETGSGAAEETELPLVPVIVGLGVLILAVGGVLLYTRRARPPAPAVAGRPVPGPRLQAEGGKMALPTAALRAERGPRAGQNLPLLRSPFVIGRSAENDLVLPETHVSRQHARLEGREGRWFLHDLGSANGTFLNRQRLATPQPLHSGDLIGIGESELLFTASAPPPPVPAVGRPGGAAVRARRSRLAAAVGVGVVLLLLIVAAVLLATGQPGAGEEGVLPGLPSLELPTLPLPTVELPTVTLPTDMPTVAVPTGMPTGLPVPTGGLPPLPTGLPIRP